MNHSAYKLFSILLIGTGFVLTVSSCGSAKTTVETPAVTVKADTAGTAKQLTTGFASLDDFLTGFENATLSHNSSLILGFLNKEYKEEQYEKLLKRHTDSFLNKFYSDNKVTKDGYVINYKKITGIKRGATSMVSGYWTVNYVISMGKENVDVTYTVMTRYTYGTMRFSLYGPVG